ncbi:MAG: YcxB family protein [Lachnospiraceae bacterium]|nr:YcxB family protein [Lachnospiraceae bacterium]
MVELDIKIESGDLYDYNLRHAYNSPAGLMGSVLGAIMIISGAVTSTWISLIGGIILLAYLPWTLFIKSKQQALSNPVFKEPLHYVLDDEGITISQGEVTTTQKWDEMLKAVSTSRSIIVYTSKVNATIFPKQQLGDKKALVIEVISTHMPTNKVKIRG